MEENIEPTQGSEGSSGEAGAEQNVSAEQSEITKDARMWGMLCHLAGLAGFAFPFGNIILPLIFWQIKKDEYPFVDKQGKEALNFQISVTIYALVSMVLFVICVGPFLLAAVCVFSLVMLIIAGIKANKGQSYRYPLTIRFIK